MEMLVNLRLLHDDTSRIIVFYLSVDNCLHSAMAVNRYLCTIKRAMLMSR